MFDFLTPPTPLIVPHRLPVLLESLMPLKISCSIHARWSIPYVSVAFFPSLKQNFIAYRSSNVSDCIFEIHQLWQSGFSRVYSNCCCSCSFEPEIIKIGQSSHNMYSKNILNFQDYDNFKCFYKKKSGNLLNAPRNKKKRTYPLVDFAIPLDLRGKIKEKENINKYFDLDRESKKLCT